MGKLEIVQAGLLFTWLIAEWGVLWLVLRELCRRRRHRPCGYGYGYGCGSDGSGRHGNDADPNFYA